MSLFRVVGEEGVVLDFLFGEEVESRDDGDISTGLNFKEAFDPINVLGVCCDCVCPLRFLEKWGKCLIGELCKDQTFWAGSTSDISPNVSFPFE